MLGSTFVMLVMTAWLPQAAATTCDTTAHYRELDFWVGEWTVQAPGGGAGATSRIERISGSCAVLENYEQPDGYSGKSINFVDPMSGKWRQVWVDSGGAVSEFTGALVDHEMRLEGETRRPGGTRVLRRMTLRPEENGDVLQSSEISRDDGRTWQPYYKLRYVRRPK